MLEADTCCNGQSEETGPSSIEAALSESEERYRVLLESIPDAIIIVSDDKIRYSNQAGLRLLGISTAAEALNMDANTVSPPLYKTYMMARIEQGDYDLTELNPFDKDHFKQTMEAFVEKPGHSDAMHIMAVQLDGCIRYFEARVVRIKWNGLPAFQFSIRDVSEHKANEERLKSYGERLESLSHQLIVTQEKERRKIAMELHDEAGQAIANARLQLHSMMQRPGAGTFENEISELSSLLEYYADKVRNISLDLRPSMLDDLGIVPALDWYVEKMNTKSAISVQFMHSGITDDIPVEIRIACYRIAQEALTNVIRHSEASYAIVELHRRDDRIMLSIRDDGRGFDVAEMQSKAISGKSLGLLGMQERCGLALGSISIKSSPGSGTEIDAVFPLRHSSHGTKS
jgi:signal transduction histidine kinase